MLLDDHLTPERIAVLRSMTPAQRWAEAERIYWEERRLKESELRIQHPHWSDQQVHAEVSRLFLAEAMKEG